MREILFKAKNLKGEWAEGYVVKRTSGEWRIHTKKTIGDKCMTVSFEIIPKTICQYTGINDDYGVKIFENDEVLFENLGFDKHSEVGKIFYKETSSAYFVEFDNIFRHEIMPLSEYIIGGGMEVLGSIYDLNYKKMR